MVTSERTSGPFFPGPQTRLLSVYVVPKCLRCPSPSAALTSAWCLGLGLIVAVLPFPFCKIGFVQSDQTSGFCV